MKPPSPQHQHTSVRKRAFRTVAVGIPTMIGLAILAGVLIRQGRLSFDDDTGAIALRSPPLYLQEPGHELTGHRYLYDELLGWRNIPGWSATTHGRPLTINEKGLRDRDYPYEKPAGGKRILVLGDSYAWGYGVSDTETFSEVVEKRLSAEQLPWEVINTGVSGWGTDQEYLFLEHEGFKYQPDVVVVAFFIGNDLDNNSAPNQYGLNKPVFVDYGLKLANVPVPKPRQAADATAVAQVSRLEPIRLTVSILDGIAKACADRDCRLVLMKFGIFLAPDLPYAIDLERDFKQAIDTAAFPLMYLDLDQRFRDRGLETQALLEGNDDGHWNAFGHQQVAVILHEFLQQQGMLE